MLADFKFNSQPPSVGYWVISGNLHIHVQRRPNWLNQKMTKLFFGWEWKDK
ncbi:hypothetical protein UFOVP240_165 [uncultured Caudovirales phage]|uniref:Uncharacterized protein n=1 Tax=uncultured Caudovirales phage TaxID=2100421 RepID=A0A6J7WUM7_9CAUD|nr:hypothetical protein UFOVP240_165 [uncultured Caudovirales phage]